MLLKNKLVLCFLGFVGLLLSFGFAPSTPKSSKGVYTMPNKPPLLAKDDTVAIVAPACWAKDSKECIKKATEVFQAWGLRVVIGKSIGPKYGMLAGEDSLRTEDLQQMLDDPTIKAILAYRGGYGTTRIIDQLDFTRFLQHPKWVVGFSDISTILFKLDKLGIVSVHGEMPRHFIDTDYQTSISSLREVLFKGTTQITAKPDIRNSIGTVAAPVVGGNLRMICANIGTQSDLDARGKILVLEDIGEYLYDLDRMMGQLKRAGKLDHLAGLVVGGMVGMKGNMVDPLAKDAYGIVKLYVASYDYPVAFNFPIGHEAPNLAFPHGGIGRLSVTEEAVSLTFD